MKVIRQGVPALLLSLAILSGSVCLASGAEVQTVRATLWDEWPITVDETPICTVNEYDRFQYPLAYNGSVYIPLQTVSDWLGARFDWDETANTVTLTKTGDPYYRHYTLDQPAPWTEEELAQCDADKAEGVEMELRPDIQIYLDGEKQTFTDAAGNRIPPAASRGVLLLPVRGAAQMCGKEITYLPSKPASPGVEGGSVTDFPLLFEPVLSDGRAAKIFLYDKPTTAQLDGAQAFLDEAERLMYEGPVNDLRELLACESLSDDDCIARLRRIGNYADDFAQLPQPEAAFMIAQYRAILTNAQDLRTYGTNEFISSVERGAAHFNDLKGDSGFSRIMTQKLYRMRFSIAEGLRMLDAVRAQTQQ